MKNEIELFIKYLENDLSQNEIKFFEEKLISDSIFKKNYDDFVNQFNSTKKKIEVDDRYFSTLIPNAKRKIEVSRKSSKVKFSLALSFIIIGFLLILNNSTDEYNSQYNFQSLLSDFTEDDSLTNELLRNVFETENSYIIDEHLLAILYEDEIQYDETMFDYIEKNLSINEINSNLFNQLSESEFNSIYEELLDKKIR